VTAAATAERVLAWAAEPSGPVPVGPLWNVTALTAPAGGARDAASQLARRTAARLGAGIPPFGATNRDGRLRIGPGAVLIAAAAGGRRQAGAAALLAGAVPPAVPGKDPGCWYDLIARHGVAGAVVTILAATETGAATGRPAPAGDTARDSDGEAQAPPPEPLPELLLAASPLTAVLYRPPLRALRSDTTGQAVATAVALLSRPRGQAVLAAGLACWTPHPHVLAWRASLLARLRLSHPDLLLDVYLAARTRFAADWDQRIPWAARQMSALAGVPDPLAVETLRFWAPLAAIERDTPLSRLRPLMSGQDRALTLVRRYRLDRTGAA
jgi:FtsH ternary system domain X1